LNYWCLPTKIRPISLSINMLSRSRVEALLQQGLKYRITCVVAPAGYGKSIALRTWFEQVEGLKSWLSLDASDDYLPRFVFYLIRSIQASVAGFAQDLEQALLVSSDLDDDFLLAGLLESFEELKEPLCLVLDDWHVIQEEPILLFMARLIEGLPQQVSCFFSSCSRVQWPGFSKLQVSGQVFDLTQETLAFTSDEIKLLFELKNISLSAEELHKIYSITEGWSICLQILSLSARQEHRNFPLTVLKNSPGTLGQYFLDEIFEALDDSLQNFLLKSSILDSFDVSLAKQTCGVNNALQDIQKLELLGLLSDVSDRDGQTQYRYHSLLSGWLQEELKLRHVDELSDLYLRAFEGYCA